MRCNKCIDIQHFCMITSKMMAGNDKGRDYLDKFANENPDLAYSKFWNAYKICMKYISEPKLLEENHNNWDELLQAIIRVCTKWDWIDLKTNIDNKSFKEVELKLTMLASYWIKCMDLTNSRFHTYLMNRYNNCYCRFFS